MKVIVIIIYASDHHHLMHESDHLHLLHKGGHWHFIPIGTRVVIGISSLSHSHHNPLHEYIITFTSDHHNQVSAVRLPSHSRVISTISRVAEIGERGERCSSDL